MVTRIPTIDLTPDRLPADVEPDGGGLDAVLAFAETFNGYAWGGGPHAIEPRVRAVHDAWEDGDGLPADADLLRGCLFHWARARRHVAGPSFDGHDRRWLNALLGGLRRALAP